VKSTVLILAAIPLLALLTACDGSMPQTADQKQRTQQEVVTEQANAQTGMPGVINFTEKKIVKKLYELRDQNIATFAYVPDMQGRLFHLCDSIGYGLPYGVQYTNPERPARSYETYEQGNITLPQPEPNGLFMPPSAEGTWIICADEKQKGNFVPVYVEPRVIVSPFKLRAEGEYALR
jgi:hypothetical protein